MRLILYDTNISESLIPTNVISESESSVDHFTLVSGQLLLDNETPSNNSKFLGHEPIVLLLCGSEFPGQKQCCKRRHGSEQNVL